MMPEIIAMTVESYQDPKNVKTEVETSQQQKGKIVARQDRVGDGDRRYPASFQRRERSAQGSGFDERALRVPAPEERGRGGIHVDDKGDAVTRAASRAWGAPVKDTTIVEAVPMRFTHTDEYVVNTR